MLGMIFLFRSISTFLVTAADGHLNIKKDFDAVSINT